MDMGLNAHSPVRQYLRVLASVKGKSSKGGMSTARLVHTERPRKTRYVEEHIASANTTEHYSISTYLALENLRTRGVFVRAHAGIT